MSKMLNLMKEISRYINYKLFVYSLVHSLADCAYSRAVHLSEVVQPPGCTPDSSDRGVGTLQHFCHRIEHSRSI